MKRGEIGRASPCGPRRWRQRAATRSAAADTRGAPLAVRVARIAPLGAQEQRVQEGIAAILNACFVAGRTGDSRRQSITQLPTDIYKIPRYV